MAEKLKKNVLIIFGTNWNKRKRGRKIKNTAIKNGAKMMTAVAAYLQSTKQNILSQGYIENIT